MPDTEATKELLEFLESEEVHKALTRGAQEWVCRIFCVNSFFAFKHIFPNSLQKGSSAVSIS